MTLPRLAERLPKTVLTPGSQGAADTPDTQTEMGIRDKAILEMFYSTGIGRGNGPAHRPRRGPPQRLSVRVNKGKSPKTASCRWAARRATTSANTCKKSVPSGARSNRDERALWLSSIQPHRPAQKPGHRRHREQSAAPPASAAMSRPTSAAHLRHAPCRQRREHRLRATVARPSLASHHADLHPDHHCRNQSDPRQGPPRGPNRDRDSHVYKPAIGKEGEPLMYRRDHHEA